MKIHTARILCLALCLVMALSACGGAGSSSAAPASSTAPASSSSAPSSASSVADAPEPAQEPLVLSGMANLFNNPPDKDGVFWTQMEETFNVKYTVDWVPIDTYQQKIELVLASGDLPDVMQIQNTTLPGFVKAVNAGAYYDITDALGDFSNYPNFANNTNQNAWTLSKIKGRNYVVPRTRGNLDSCLMIRKDWLDNLGLAVPTTVDEFADVIVQVVNSNPNGTGNTIGLVPSTESDGFWTAAWGTREMIYDEDGGITHKLLTDNHADFVEYMQGLYEKGAVAKEFALILGQQQEELFITGQSVTFVKNAWHKFRMNEETKKSDPNADVVLIPYLKGPKGIAHIYDLGYFGGMAISAKCDEEKVKRILEFFDASCAEEHYNFVNFGVEGVHYTIVDDAPSLTEEGIKEVTNTFNAPFIFASNEFAKVDSPLADRAYNLQTREEMKVLYNNGGEIDKFSVMQSDAWSDFWSEHVDEYKAEQTKAISGAITMEAFRDYQQKLRDDPKAKQAAQEFAQSHLEFFGE